MGTRAYSHVVIGFPVKEDDFLNVIDGPVGCGNGHPRGDKKYCGECGGLFMSRKMTLGTTALVYLAQADMMCPDDGWAIKAWDELREDSTAKGRQERIHRVDAVHGSQDPGLVLAFGIRVARQAGDPWGQPSVNAIPFEQIQEMYRRIETVRAALGMSTRQIVLYTSMYWG